jgi:hypothetical protein
MTLSTKDMTDRHIAVTHPGGDTFHRAVAAITVLAQCFALLPVDGVTAASVEALRCVGSRAVFSCRHSKQIRHNAEEWQRCAKFAGHLPVFMFPSAADF